MRLTTSNEVLGTPLYISPEQLTGQPADARSDQFSFCVALYEALYAQHPFYVPRATGRDTGAPTDSQGQERTLPPHVILFEAVLSGPLRSPPRGTVPRRIFDILARGLQRDPAQRYTSMRELLADLERDPRRRTLWALGGVAVGGLALGLGYAQMRPPAVCVDVAQEVAGLWDDARRAEVRDAFTATKVPYAAASFTAIDGALTDYLGAWTRSRAQACDATYVHGTKDRPLHERNMACLDQRRTIVDAAIDELARIDADTIAGAVDRLRTLPRIEDCDSRLLLRQSCTIEPDDPASRRVRDAIQTARAAELSGRFLKAEPLAAAVAQAAATHGVAELSAEAHFIHGRILAELSRPEEAREALLAALDLAEGAGCEGLAAELGTWIAKLVALHPALEAQLGVDWSRYSFAKLRRLPDDRLRRADALNDRGLLRERREHHYPAAEQDYREALALREPDSARTLAVRAVNHLNLGSVLGAQNRYPEALIELWTSLDLYREAYGEGHPNLWKPLFNIGAVATEAGALADAEEALTQALALTEHAFGPDNRKVLEAHNALVKLFSVANREDRARKQALIAIAGCDRNFPATEPLCLDIRRQLAQSLEILGEEAEALTIREQVLTLMQAAADPRLGEAHLELAASLVQLERWQPALEHADAALSRVGADDLAADASLYRGDALLGLGRPGDAISPYERALSTWNDGPADARARVEWGLARALCGAGREIDRARMLARRARPVLASDKADPMTPRILADIDAWTCRPDPSVTHQ
jgi:tetratricopeptide (TPR) repeat protein